MQSRSLAVVVVTASLGLLAGCPGREPTEGEGEAGEGEGEGEGEEGEGEGEEGEGEGEGSDCAVLPGGWDAEPADWAENAAEALALRAQLDTLTGAATMRGAEQGTVVVDDVADLTAVFEAGELSLADVTTPAYAAIVNDAFAEFVALVAVGDLDVVDDAGQFEPGASGGVFGTSDRGINTGGLEVRQVVDKGLFAGGAFYPYALGLTEGPIDVATIDALSAIWGGNDALDAAGTLADGADYTFDMGYHAAAAASLTVARAYAADAACVAERDEAIVGFFRTWERAMFARATHYAHVAATEAAAAADDDGYASALHQLGEGAGLALGFYGVEDPATGPLAGAGRLVTDAQIEDIADALGIDIADLGASSSGVDLIEANFATAVTAVEAIVGPALGVDAAEVAGWREPTAG